MPPAFSQAHSLTQRQQYITPAGRRQRRQPAARQGWRTPRASPTVEPVTRGIDRNGKDVVALRAKWDQGYTVQLLSTCTPTVSEYLAGAEQHLQRYQLPLGAKLTVVDLANQRWQLQIPKIQFFGIFIQPCADVRLYTPQGELQVRTEGVSIEGSKQVTDLGLQHRYDVDVNVDIVAQSDDAFHAASDLTLYVDVPFPFSMTPKPVLAATGNAVVAALLASLMRGFCGIVVADIEGEYSGSGAMK